MEKRPTKLIETTLGELIAAASEVAFEYSDSDKEAYQMARLALIEILRKARLASEEWEPETPGGKSRYLH
ncbi:MAG TPA: hypothetical protein VNO43_17935 [Candidatus Eisenbacteria bacterium]|nr:hypothetical protein [Candidatus Eisenbacteria bacterium]